MTTALVHSPQLGDHVVAHLDAQIASARRLLSSVLGQGQAIRAREGTRTAILTTAGAALGIPPHTVTIESLAQLLAPAHATTALQRSSELRGLLGEIAREHAINRVLMRQELAFLDHLMRELGAEPDTGYGDLSGRSAAHAAVRSTQASFRTLDLQA